MLFLKYFLFQLKFRQFCFILLYTYLIDEYNKQAFLNLTRYGIRTLILFFSHFTVFFFPFFSFPPSFQCTLITINVAAQTPVKPGNFNSRLSSQDMISMDSLTDHILVQQQLFQEQHTLWIRQDQLLLNARYPWFSFTHNHVVHCSSTNIKGSMDNIS